MAKSKSLTDELMAYTEEPLAGYRCRTCILPKEQRKLIDEALAFKEKHSGVSFPKLAQVLNARGVKVTVGMLMGHRWHYKERPNGTKK